MSAKIIDGKKIAANIRKKVADDVKKLKTKYGTTPSIVTVKIGRDPQSDLYLKLRDKACREVGIYTSHVELSNKISEKKAIEEIKKLNKNNNTHGILIQFPIPKNISQEKLINSIYSKKDVEGFTAENMGRLLLGDEHIVPCTPLAVLKILEEEKTVLEGKDVVVVNHSTIVGKPLAGLLLNRNASVSVVHVFTKDLKKYTSEAEVLVSATGVPRLITGDYVKKDAFVIDVGIIKTTSGVCGDIDFESVKNKAGKLTPVPGGVGPVTVACSLVNMVKTFKSCIEDVNE
jgi:methylenetetrahydrofolate dehydrogenase (NADP+)/methenyltetrahydrofolate cyclohydrolase